MFSASTIQSMNGNDSDSSDDDWVITETATDLSTSMTTSSSPLFATIRTIQSSLCTSQHTEDTFLSQWTTEISYINQKQLESICSSMDGHLLVRRLVDAFNNTEAFLRIKDTNKAKTSFDTRLSESLHLCSDPGCFILVKEQRRLYAVTKSNECDIGFHPGNGFLSFSVPRS